MAIRNKESRSSDPVLERLRRKRDQAWEMAGLARQDGDKKDEDKWTNEAMKLQTEIGMHSSYEK